MRRDWCRFYVGRIITWPMFQIAAIGDDLWRVGDRIIEWSERAR